MHAIVASAAGSCTEELRPVTAELNTEKVQEPGAAEKVQEPGAAEKVQEPGAAETDDVSSRTISALLHVLFCVQTCSSETVARTAVL